METDSFIQALRRFMARRGKVRSIRSDNGTNFVGTDNELRKALKEMNQDQIRNYLLQNGTDWITWYKNPPGASHMGGVWECHIQSARSILAALLKTHAHSLNEEGLRTIVAETEAIIYSRPLTVKSLSDINSEIPLSPSNLLTMKSDVNMPPQKCSIDQTCTHVDDGDECSILLGNFGPVDKKNSFRVSKHDKSGI